MSPQTSATCVWLSSWFSKRGRGSRRTRSAASPTPTRLTSDSVRDPVLDQIGDRDHQQPVLLRELRQLRHARHRAVFVHDFADDAGRIQPGDPRQIDRRFGLAGAHQHAAGARRAAETCGPAARDRPACVAGSIAASTVAARSAAEMPVRRRAASPRSARRTPVSNRERVLRHHQRNLELVEPLRRHRQADQPAAVARHEVDRLRRHLLGRDRQVAFVLAILVVDDDDHPAGADRLDGVLDAGERRAARLRDRALGDLDRRLRAFMSQCVTSPGADAGQRQSGQFRGADDVLADHVAFEVDAVADLRRGRGSCAPS